MTLSKSSENLAHQVANNVWYLYELKLKYLKSLSRASTQKMKEMLQAKIDELDKNMDDILERINKEITSDIIRKN